MKCTTVYDAVNTALEHIRSIHPDVVQVFFDVTGRWRFMDVYGEPVEFNGKEDISLLEYTQRLVPSPYAQAIKLPEGVTWSDLE